MTKIRSATLHFAILTWAFMAVAHVPSTTWSRSADTVKAEYDSAYQQALQNPSDVDLSLKLSRLAVEMGDYEAAIPPLERIHMTNPHLVRVKLDLGILHHRLGSNKIAKQYFEQVKANAEATPDMVRDADLHLSKIR